MILSTSSTSQPRLRNLSRIAWLATAACALTWTVPIFSRHDGYFGHYTPAQLAFGSLLFALAAGLWSVVASHPAKKRVATFRAAAIGIGLAIGLVGAELAYALLRPDPINPFYQVDPRWNLPDEELGFVRKPNLTWEGRSFNDPDAHHVVYRTDENGFRNAPGIETADLVFIGDSFTEAGNVPENDTFVQQVGRDLRRPVVNLGRSYYGPQQELLVLQRYALRYNPSCVVWVLFEGNDLIDAERYRLGHMERPAQATPTTPTPFFESLLTHRLLSRWWTPAATTPDDGLPRWWLTRPDGSEDAVEFLIQYQPDAIAALPRAWTETKRCLAEGFSLCSARGIRLVVVVVPIKFRVYGPFVRVETEHGEMQGPLPQDLTRPGGFTEQVRDFCDSLGCDFVDPYPALLKAARRGQSPYSLRYDTHLDIPGHRIVAERITHTLRIPDP